MVFTPYSSILALKILHREDILRGFLGILHAARLTPTLKGYLPSHSLRSFAWQVASGVPEVGASGSHQVNEALAEVDRHFHPVLKVEVFHEDM